MDVISTEKLLATDYLHVFASRFRHGIFLGDWYFVSRQPEPNSLRPNAVVIVPFMYTEHEHRKTSASVVVNQEYRVPFQWREG